MYDENWLAIWPSKYQEIDCSSLSLTTLAKSAMGLSSNSFSVSDFYSTKSLSIKRRCSLSTDPPIITQKPRVQASPLLHSPPETLSVRGRDIIAAFIQWPSSIEELKKNCSNQPHWSQWTLGFNREVHWRYGNVGEANRVSRPICSWFWTNSSSRWTCSNAF